MTNLLKPDNRCIVCGKKEWLIFVVDGIVYCSKDYKERLDRKKEIFLQKFQSKNGEYYNLLPKEFTGVK